MTLWYIVDENTSAHATTIRKQKQRAKEVLIKMKATISNAWIR